MPKEGDLMSVHDDEFPDGGHECSPIHAFLERHNAGGHAPAVFTEKPRHHRGSRLDLMTPLETAAFELIRACESAGGHPLLTAAQCAAIRARELLAEWIDAGAQGANGVWVTETGAPWRPALHDRDYPRPWGFPALFSSIDEIGTEQAPVDDCAVHLSHCNQGEYAGSCKYGLDGCPALEPAPEQPQNPELKNWRILAADGSWFNVKGKELRREESWIEIYGAGKRHLFHRPQAVEQIDG